MEIFACTLDGDAFKWFFEELPSKSITSLLHLFEIFLKRWCHHDGDIKKIMAMLPIEELHGISVIEDIVEDPSHVTLTKNMEDLECSHDYFSDGEVQARK